jgi:hypothetical protein
MSGAMAADRDQGDAEADGFARRIAPAPLRWPPRSVAIVGNAPETGDAAAAIDAADWVVRFNNAAGFGGGTGRRVTHLALVNHGGQMREWLDDPFFVHRPAVRGAAAFVFPFGRKPAPGDDGPDGADWTAEAERMLAPLGQPVAALPERSRRRAEAWLAAAAGRDAPPSTGFLVGFCLLDLFAGMRVRVDVRGFGFAGWSGHAFDAERRWFEAMEEAGRLVVHAPRGDRNGGRDG